MEKDFVPYEPSLALKELGFDEPCLGVYYESKTFYIYTKSKGVKNSDKTSQSWVFTAPLYQQAFKWLYQKLDIEKGVMPLDTESQQLLLKELIEIVKNK
jgi:hypothetical protein